MLKKIPPIISPDLICTLMKMGHGDEITFGDCNFPARSIAESNVCIDATGLLIPDLLTAIEPYFPLDYASEANIYIMKVPPEFSGCAAAHEIYNRIFAAEGRSTGLEKPDFYARARKSFAVVATGDRSRFANIILRKGIIRTDE